MKIDIVDALRASGTEMHEEAAEELERLREKKEQQHSEIGLLLKRIEELENSTFTIIQDGNSMKVFFGDAEVPFEKRIGHIITTDQIRAAWALTEQDPPISNGAWLLEKVLKECFNIVRCEGCGGSGGLSGYSHLHKCDMDADCGRCNGEGWRILVERILKMQEEK